MKKFLTGLLTLVLLFAGGVSFGSTVAKDSKNQKTEVSTLKAQSDTMVAVISASAEADAMVSVTQEVTQTVIAKTKGAGSKTDTPDKSKVSSEMPIVRCSITQ